MKDSFGNTALHLCVIHCLEEMYDHVCKTAKRILEREIKLKYFTKQNSKEPSKLLYMNLDPFEDAMNPTGIYLYSIEKIFVQ